MDQDYSKEDCRSQNMAEGRQGWQVGDSGSAAGKFLGPRNSAELFKIEDLQNFRDILG